MRGVIVKLYQFEELSDAAKEKAREWYRTYGLDYEWWDSVYEEAKEIAALMGIEIDNIYFSGFFSQGDGAQFTGTYQYRAGSVKAVKEYAPQDEKLHAIVNDLYELQKRRFYRLSAKVASSGHYSHEYCTRIDVYDDSDEVNNTPDLHTDEQVAEALRSFMRWIYRQLEEQYWYLQSDEWVDETITINEYEFTEDGRRSDL